MKYFYFCILFIFFIILPSCEKKHEVMFDVPRLLDMSPADVELSYPRWKDKVGHWNTGSGVQFFFYNDAKNTAWGGGTNPCKRDDYNSDADYLAHEIETYTDHFETKEAFLDVFGLNGEMVYIKKTVDSWHFGAKIGTCIIHSYRYERNGRTWLVSLFESIYKNKKRYLLGAELEN